jgi:hypothetical protein
MPYVLYSGIAPAVLDLFRKALVRNRAYMERVKRHYRMFRAEIDKGAAASAST